MQRCPGRRNLAGRWILAVPASNRRLRWHGLSGSAACWRFRPATLFTGTSDFPPPLALAFDATGPVTSPTHSPLSPFVSRTSACAVFLPAAARRTGQDGLVRFTSYQNAGYNVRRPNSRLPPRNGARPTARTGLLSDARSDRGARHRPQRLSGRPPLAPCSVANFVWPRSPAARPPFWPTSRQRRSRRMKPMDSPISVIRASPST